MNGWTKKRKVDTFMGILLQVYCFFPWMHINRKWNTIHMYVIKTFQENDYIKMYNHKMIAEAKKYAEQFQIEHLLKKNPYELSGGEKQRVAIK